MWTRKLVLLTLITIGFLIPPASFADTMKLKDGTQMEGVIKKVENGRVFILVANEEKVVDILCVECIDFNTPHLFAIGNVPVEHFLKNVEAQEVVRNFQELEKTEAEVRSMLMEIRAYWSRAQPIPSKD